MTRARVSRALAALALLTGLTAGSEPSQLEVSLEGLRDTRGVLLLCMTGEERFFANCRSDPAAAKARVAASLGVVLLDVPAPGAYAVSVIHDHNSNGKLDTVVGIPREGFGFSRNPPLRPGRPSFASVRITLGEGVTRTRVRLRYVL